MSNKSQVTIIGLGSRGDGIANINGERRYIKNGLPGEEWQIHNDGSLRRVFDSPLRASPPCIHFGTCGGCVAQHMHKDLYIRWKLEGVEDAFKQRGISPQVGPLQMLSIGSRRRASLGVERFDGHISIGFREEKTNTILDISECLVLDQDIVTIVPDLKKIAEIAMPNNSVGRIIVTRVDTGLDVDFQNGFKQLLPDERSEISHIAENKNIIRLIVSQDIIIIRAHPRLTFAGVEVDIPSSVFLQPVPAAEQIMVNFVLNSLPKKIKKVCDLFCGIGTFTFHLAKRAEVLAYDNDSRAISALMEGSKNSQGLKPIQACLRDLFREPLSPKELDNFDVVLLDPPRIGASKQFQQLARSKVPTIIAVSCAPSTLARDARILIDAGYEIGPITCIDQFMFSAHLEVMTVFKKRS
ncbi:MAG: class I SAM-dependent RNA methyltransferase [Hyphomicrobium sp.]